MARFAAAVAAIGVVVLFASFAWARTAAPGDPELQLLGQFASPIYVTAPPGDGGRVFVVEKAGRIRVVKNGSTLPAPFLDITGPVNSSASERGLLSMAFAPDYATSGRFYVYYTADSPTGQLTISEFQRSANPDVASPAERILLGIPHADNDNHNGGQLQFGPDGYLYLGTGDGGGQNDPNSNAQNLGSLLGKLLRIDPRLGPGGEAYTVPATNPFVGQAGSRPEIWSYGLRNPWRFSFDRLNGDLSIADVGQNDWEEIDFVAAASGGGRGINFGWKCFEGKHAYSNNPPHCSPRPTNHTPPVHEYSHSRGCSITGGYVSRDPALPALAGRYVYGDYCQSPLWSVVLQSPNGSDDRQLGLSVPGLFSFGEDACGRVYVVRGSGTGPVYRLVPAEISSPDTCDATQPPAPPPPGPPPPPGSPPPPPPAGQAGKVCKVPRAIGLRLRTARARVRRANCRVGRIRYRRAARARGRVVSQSPRPGARRVRGTRVKLNVSRGRR